ncbi:50S ribosomal protein L1 [soil metagenome]
MANQNEPETADKEAVNKSEASTPANEKKPNEKGAKAASEGAAASPTVSSAPGNEKKRGKQPGIPPVRGKKLRGQMKSIRTKIAKEGVMPVKKAIGLLKQSKRAKFDETVEIHMSLGIDPTQNDQMVRGSVPLPHGIGKVTRVVVFCQGDNVAKATAAGADVAGSDDLIKKIQGGWLDFDVALATQDMMGVVSRLGKLLGPRGLMQTPKAGTVIPAGADVSGAIKEFKAGKVEYRADKGGNVHAGVGKLSFDEEKLMANVATFVEQIRSVKPSGVKGNYVKSITISATMSPGILVTV